jgi:SAM-dependent methyltransferase
MGQNVKLVIPMEQAIAAPLCRFCRAEPSSQSVKGQHVYGGNAEQHFWQCRDCQIIYLWPPPSEEEERKFYNQEFEKYMEQRAGADMDWSGPERHFQANQREVARRIPFLQPYLKKGQRVLEIGCSSGFMLVALRDLGLTVFGLDPSGGFTAFVRSKGIDVYAGLEELGGNHGAKFDLILHYFTLEHIRNPVEFLDRCMEFLNEEGRMIFEVPCATDPLVELYHVPAFQQFYWSVAHHWYFNKESLARLLRKTRYSFELFPDQRYDLSNHMTWMLDGKPGGLGRYKHIFGDEVDRAYKEQLKRHWLCDTLIAVVSK